MALSNQQPAFRQRRQRVSTGLSKKCSGPSADAECLRARLLILQAQEKEGQTARGMYPSGKIQLHSPDPRIRTQAGARARGPDRQRFAPVEFGGCSQELSAHACSEWLGKDQLKGAKNKLRGTGRRSEILNWVISRSEKKGPYIKEVSGGVYSEH